MQTKITETLKEAISKVLERMFFQTVVISEERGPLQEWFSRNQAPVAAKIEIDGDLPGTLYLISSPEALKDLTDNFMGVEGEMVQEEQKQDVLKEALNMIGGQMLSLMDKEGKFHIGLPQFLPESKIARSGMKGDFVLVSTGQHQLAAGIVLDRSQGEQLGHEEDKGPYRR
jgi:CheY-specific phosphatase CheX